MNSIREERFNGQARPTLAEYLCNKWAKDHGIEIRRIDMYVISETITAETVNTPDKRQSRTALFYAHKCSANTSDAPSGNR